ncbi:MAG TPA: hypothetical protein VLB82_08725 [Thermodesulfobacteriota bacterium]|nr:hypothetical protein [Thermodesulfobacteriota bacterium]
MYICSRCYYSGLPTGGAVEAKSGGLSGFINSLFGSGNKKLSCPNCEKETFISLVSDEGKEILDSVTK